MGMMQAEDKTTCLTNPAAKQLQRQYTSTTKSHHAALRHITHGLTHKRRSTPPPHCSRMLTSLPGLKSKSTAPGSQQPLANEPRE